MIATQRLSSYKELANYRYTQELRQTSWLIGEAQAIMQVKADLAHSWFGGNRRIVTRKDAGEHLAACQEDAEHNANESVDMTPRLFRSWYEDDTDKFYRMSLLCRRWAK